MFAPGAGREHTFSWRSCYVTARPRAPGGTPRDGVCAPEQALEEPVLYVPTSPSGAPEPAPTPGSAVRGAVRGLRGEAERRAWATRPLFRPAAVPSTGAAESDPLVGHLAQLRAVTTQFVCGLRADGARPEQMLPRVKTLVREAMSAEGWHDPEAARALTEHVVRWSIDAYYDR